MALVQATLSCEYIIRHVSNLCTFTLVYYCNNIKQYNRTN